MKDIYSIPAENYNLQLRPIGFIRTDFKEKFGIPRQPGMVPGLEGIIEFTEEFRNADCIRGLEEFNYIWLIFGFSKNWNQQEDGDFEAKWSPLVRPPRLGGQTKVGVFATRSPYRPSGLGLSSVKLIRKDMDDGGNPILVVGGADLLDGTPIYDIKPYIPYSDVHDDANAGFAKENTRFLEVVFPEHLLNRIEKHKRQTLINILEQDPRGAYEKKSSVAFGLKFASYDVRFQVEDTVLTVVDVTDANADNVK